MSDIDLDDQGLEARRVLVRNFQIPSENKHWQEDLTLAAGAQSSANSVYTIDVSGFRFATIMVDFDTVLNGDSLSSLLVFDDAKTKETLIISWKDVNYNGTSASQPMVQTLVKQTYEIGLKGAKFIKFWKTGIASTADPVLNLVYSA